MLKTALAYFELTKPRLTAMALATALLGFVIASSGPLNYVLLWQLLLGAAFVGGGANALNQLDERDVDAKMKRTKNRPLPSGRIRQEGVLLFGCFLAVLGVTHLFIFVNRLTGTLALITFASYVFIYTPLKRRTPLNTFVGAVPGALPILMGYAAAKRELALESWVLFLFLFVWQLPHFLSIAWVYREDYAKSGLKMLTVSDEKGERTAWQIVLFSTILWGVSTLPGFVGMAGTAYFVWALTLGLIFVGLSLGLVVKKLSYAKQFITVSIVYLALIIFGMMADKI